MNFEITNEQAEILKILLQEELDSYLFYRDDKADWVKNIRAMLAKL